MDPQGGPTHRGFVPKQTRNPNGGPLISVRTPPIIQYPSKKIPKIKHFYPPLPLHTATGTHDARAHGKRLVFETLRSTLIQGFIRLCTIWLIVHCREVPGKNLETSVCIHCCETITLLSIALKFDLDAMLRL